MTREVTEGELVHDGLGAERFEEKLSLYDTERRVEVLVDELLGEDRVRGRRVLDVGCGLGYFSRRLVELGADVTACDIGPNMVAETERRAGCRAVVADALALRDTFAEGEFDGVVSSECIEHTPAPATAIREMGYVVRPGGFLSLSTPNLLWWPAVRLATLLRIRPFDGHENFTTLGALRRNVEAAGFDVVGDRGVHLFPFQFGMHGLSRSLDRGGQALRRLMINLCVLGRRR